MNEAKFNFTDLLPLTSDPYTTTNFRKLSEEGVKVVEGPDGKEFVEVSAEAIGLLGNSSNKIFAGEPSSFSTIFKAIL